jgi:hypothetical protein
VNITEIRENAREIFGRWGGQEAEGVGPYWIILVFTADQTNSSLFLRGESAE